MYEDILYIFFHKSCVDGFLSAYVMKTILPNLKINKNISFVPLSPREVLSRSETINQYMNVEKIILDLPLFGTKILYYFDHHITNYTDSSKMTISGKYDANAKSSLDLIVNYFQNYLTETIIRLVEFANIIDQAKFTTSPPSSTLLKLESKNDIIWAFNDLFKGITDNYKLIQLIDDFDPENYVSFFKKHSLIIQNYRNFRKRTLALKSTINCKPIMLIVNFKKRIQSEALHFTYIHEYSDYKLLIIIERQSTTNSRNQMYRITFRQNPNLNEGETLKYRVDFISKQLGGGGHKGAAGAVTHNFNLAYESIINWLDKIGIAFSETYIQ